MEKLKVLVVEDDRNVRIIYDAGLSGEVFEKQFVGNGKDALQVYQSWRPDIILLDMMLPEVSGYSLLKTVREEILDATTTIIMSTCISGKVDVLACVKVGVQGYIVKPFTHKEIADKVLDCYRKVNPERADAAQAALVAVREQKSKS
jgi:DNA-binding response OmpR family regulator